MINDLRQHLVLIRFDIVLNLGASSNIEVVVSLDIITINTANDKVSELVRSVLKGIPSYLGIKSTILLLVVLLQEVNSGINGHLWNLFAFCAFGGGLRLLGRYTLVGILQKFAKSLAGRAFGLRSSGAASSRGTCIRRWLRASRGLVSHNRLSSRQVRGDVCARAFWVEHRRRSARRYMWSY
jgi:hypothetical protein